MKKFVTTISKLWIVIISIPIIGHAASVSDQNISNKNTFNPNIAADAGQVGIVGNNTNLSSLNINAQPLVRTTVIEVLILNVQEL